MPVLNSQTSIKLLCPTVTTAIRRLGSNLGATEYTIATIVCDVRRQHSFVHLRHGSGHHQDRAGLQIQPACRHAFAAGSL